jgi:uncharacterized linocin/CFP29 family protein
VARSLVTESTTYMAECGGGFDGVVNAPGDVTVRDAPGEAGFCRAMALLKLPAKDGPVYFVLNTKRYLAERSWGGSITPHEQLAYLYGEHSCPTNWINECCLISQNGDFDPHGFLKFVRHVDVQQDFDEGDDEAIFGLFPEMAAS